MSKEITKEKKLKFILECLEKFNKSQLHEICMLVWIVKRQKDFKYTISYDVLEFIMKKQNNIYIVYDEFLRIYNNRTLIEQSRALSLLGQ